MFGELEERLKDVLDRVRGKPAAAGPAGAPSCGLIIRDVMDPQFLQKQLQGIQAAARQRGAGLPTLPDAAQAAAELKAASAAGTKGAPFMPRTASNSMLQSILTTCVETCTDRLVDAAPEGLARIAHAVLRDIDIFREFGPCDPLWIETKLAEGWSMIEGRPAFPSAPPPPVPLAEDARVILLGD